MVINKHNQKGLFDSFSLEREIFEYKQAMLYISIISFLFKENFLDNRVNVFSHLAVTGGIVGGGTEVVGVIQELGSSFNL